MLDEGKHASFFSNVVEIKKKGKQTGVKSLTRLIYISFSISNFVQKNAHLFDKINGDVYSI